MVTTKTVLSELRKLMTHLAEDLLTHAASDAKIDGGLKLRRSADGRWVTISSGG